MIYFVDYLASKEFTFVGNNINNPTTTITSPIQNDKNKVDCYDGGVMWNGDKGTLLNAAGDWITYENCDEHAFAKSTGYDFTSKPIPGVTEGVGFGSSSSPTTTLPSIYPTITNLSSGVTIAENQTSVITINATNPASGSMTYALSGTDAHLMTVDSDGVIVLNSDANYEEKSSYSLTAEVTNSNGTTSEAFTINVSDTSEDGIIDLLYVAAGGARDIDESTMNTSIDDDITTNNTIFTDIKVDITYTKREFLDATENLNVKTNQQYLYL